MTSERWNASLLICATTPSLTGSWANAVTDSSNANTIFFIGRILRGRTGGAPAAGDEHEARLARQIVAAGIRMQRVARQQEHAMAVLLDRLRHAANHRPGPRPG